MPLSSSHKPPSRSILPTLLKDLQCIKARDRDGHRYSFLLYSYVASTLIQPAKIRSPLDYCEKALVYNRIYQNKWHHYGRYSQGTTGADCSRSKTMRRRMLGKPASSTDMNQPSNDADIADTCRILFLSHGSVSKYAVATRLYVMTAIFHRGGPHLDELGSPQKLCKRI